MTVLDSATRAAIAAAVREEVSANMPRDRWLTPEQVKAQYGMISQNFLNRHGYELERRRLRTPSGETTRYAYSQRSIERMLEQ